MSLKMITTPRGSIVTTKNGKAELTWNSDFAARRNAQFTKKQMFIDSEVLRRCSPRVPIKTGMLEKSGKLGTGKHQRRSGIYNQTCRCTVLCNV